MTLKNGGSVRGTVISMEPGSKVVILEYGQEKPRTLVWAEVADVQKGKFAKSGPGASPEAPSEAGETGPGYAPIKKRRTIEQDDDGADEEPEAKRDGVKVHVDSPEPVELYQQTGAAVVRTGRYVTVVGIGQKVCSSPCDVEVDSGGRYAIVGDGMPSSRVFKIPKGDGSASVKVTPGSSGLLIGGITLLSVGGAAIAGGIGAIVFGSIGDDYVDSEPAYIGGGIALGAGAATLAGGIVMLVFGRTTVEITPGGGAPEASAGETFAIDSRPAAVAPRYWLGEF